MSNSKNKISFPTTNDINMTILYVTYLIIQETKVVFNFFTTFIFILFLKIDFELIFKIFLYKYYG